MDPKGYSKIKFLKMNILDSRHFKNVKCNDSSTSWSILMNFGSVMRTGPPNPIFYPKYEI